jgi:hypothetical protein
MDSVITDSSASVGSSLRLSGMDLRSAGWIEIGHGSYTPSARHAEPMKAPQSLRLFLGETFLLVPFIGYRIGMAPGLPAR